MGLTWFWDWINRTRLDPKHKRVVKIVLQDEQHNPVLAWKLVNARPMKWTGPTLAAKGGSEVAMEAGDVACAERALKQVVAKAKYSEFRNPEDHVKLVQTLLAKGDPEQAAGVVRDLDRSMGGRANVAACSAIASAMLHDHTGNKERAAESLGAALAACDGSTGLSAGVKMELARTCLNHGMEEGAAGVMRDVMRNAPNQQAVAKAMAVLENAGRGALAQELASESRQQVVDLIGQGAARARERDFRGAVELMSEAVARLSASIGKLPSARQRLAASTAAGATAPSPTASRRPARSRRTPEVRNDTGHSTTASTFHVAR